MAADRVVALIVLTACIFGFTSYFQDGTWIFPFPLYEVGMVVAVVSLFIIERRKPDLPACLVFSWSILQLLTSQFALEILLNDRELQHFFTGYIPDIIHGVFCIVFMAWGIVISCRIDSALVRKLAIGCFALFSLIYLIALSPYLQYGLGMLDSDARAAFAANLVYFAAAPLLATLGLLFTGKEKLHPHLHILALFLFFYLTKYGTLLFFGLSAM